MDSILYIREVISDINSPNLQFLFEQWAGQFPYAVIRLFPDNDFVIVGVYLDKHNSGVLESKQVLDIARGIA